MRWLPGPTDEEIEKDDAIGAAPAWGTFSGGRASPEDVLEAVDELLRAHGLEIVQYQDRRPDRYLFRIEPRVKR